MIAPKLLCQGFSTVSSDDPIQNFQLVSATPGQYVGTWCDYIIRYVVYSIRHTYMIFREQGPNPQKRAHLNTL